MTIFVITIFYVKRRLRKLNFFYFYCLSVFLPVHLFFVLFFLSVRFFPELSSTSLQWTDCPCFVCISVSTCSKTVHIYYTIFIVVFVKMYNIFFWLHLLGYCVLFFKKSYYDSMVFGKLLWFLKIFLFIYLSKKSNAATWHIYFL